MWLLSMLGNRMGGLGGLGGLGGRRRRGFGY